MQSSFNPRSVAAAMAGAMLLSGCVGPVAVKEVVQNPDSYSANNLSEQQLNPAVRQQLPAPGADPLPFKRLRAKGTQEYTVTGQQPVKSTFESTYFNDLNDGLVRWVAKYSQNGVPDSFLITLNYRGTWSLMSQSGRYTANTMAPIISVQRIAGWPADFRDVKENGTYTFKYEAAYRGALGNFGQESMTCHSGALYDARQVSAGIPGKAIDLECSRTNPNGAVTANFKHVWLAQYGITLLTQSSTARLTSTYHYDSITAE